MNSKKTAIRHDNSSSDCSHAMVEDLWLDKHAPTSLKELAMHVRKVNDIKSWIERALAAHDQAQRSAEGLMGFRPFVLALCGGSGCCKSTAIDVICRELDVQVKRWTDDSWEAEASTRFGLMRLGVGMNHTGGHANSDSQEHEGYQSYAAQREEELSDFALRSAYPTVGLTRKAPAPPPTPSSRTTSTTTTVSSSSRATKPMPSQVTLRMSPPPVEMAKRRKLNENSRGMYNTPHYLTTPHYYSTALLTLQPSAPNDYT